MDATRPPARALRAAGAAPPRGAEAGAAYEVLAARWMCNVTWAMKSSESAGGDCDTTRDFEHTDWMAVG